MRRRVLAVLLFGGRCTCALLPAAQKGKGFDVVRYRRGAGSTLAVLRFSCLPNLMDIGCWLFSGAPASRTQRVAAVGFALELRKAPFSFSEATARPAGPATQPRRGEDGPKRAACGREGTLPRKPRQLLSCSGANSPPVRQEGGLDVRPPSGEEAVRRSLTDGRGMCKAWGEAINSLKYDK